MGSPAPHLSLSAGLDDPCAWPIKVAHLQGYAAILRQARPQSASFLSWASLAVAFTALSISRTTFSSLRDLDRSSTLCREPERRRAKALCVGPISGGDCVTSAVFGADRAGAVSGAARRKVATVRHMCEGPRWGRPPRPCSISCRAHWARPVVAPQVQPSANSTWPLRPPEPGTCLLR